VRKILLGVIVAAIAGVGLVVLQTGSEDGPAAPPSEFGLRLANITGDSTPRARSIDQAMDECLGLPEGTSEAARANEPEASLVTSDAVRQVEDSVRQARADLVAQAVGGSNGVFAAPVDVDGATGLAASRLAECERSVHAAMPSGIELLSERLGVALTAMEREFWSDEVVQEALGEWSECFGSATGLAVGSPSEVLDLIALRQTEYAAALNSSLPSLNREVLAAMGVHVGDAEVLDLTSPEAVSGSIDVEPARDALLAAEGLLSGSRSCGVGADLVMPASVAEIRKRIEAKFLADNSEVLRTIEEEIGVPAEVSVAKLVTR